MELSAAASCEHSPSDPPAIPPGVPCVSRFRHRRLLAYLCARSFDDTFRSSRASVLGFSATPAGTGWLTFSADLCRLALEMDVVIFRYSTWTTLARGAAGGSTPSITSPASHRPATSSVRTDCSSSTSPTCIMSSAASSPESSTPLSLLRIGGQALLQRRTKTNRVSVKRTRLLV